MKKSRAVLIAATLMFLSNACAEDADYPTACTLVGLTAVRVQIAGDQPVVAVTATHDGRTQPCTALRLATGSQDAGVSSDYACIEMGGGEYVITVHGVEQRWVGRAQVKADECHVTELSTIVVDLSSEAIGPAEFAVCDDGSNRRDCCKEAMPHGGPCSTPMLYCVQHCDLPSAEANIGTQNSYTCIEGRWTSNGSSRCVRPGVGEEEL